MRQLRPIILGAACILSACVTSGATVAQSKSQTETRRVQALLRLIVAVMPDTVASWTMIDSTSIRDVAGASSEELRAISAKLGSRAIIQGTIADSSCPSDANRRCLAVRIDEATYERQSWFYRVHLWNPSPNACGSRVDVFRIGYYEDKAIVVSHEYVGGGSCGPPRVEKPPLHSAR